MEKGKALEGLPESLQEKLNLNLDSNSQNIQISSSKSPSQQNLTVVPFGKPRPPSLLSLCLGVVGSHFEDIMEDLSHIAASFPSFIKMAMAAIARRRKLLTDDVIIYLAESFWETLDLSGSDVSDFGLSHVARTCAHLRAVDISCCGRITPHGVAEFLQHCRSLEILRWGGCPRSEYTARSCLNILKPNLCDVEGESWEELDAREITHGAQSLRWLLWPKIDKDSLESLSTECPRIIINPKPSPLGYRGIEIPKEALQNVALDAHIVQDIDPKTWLTSGYAPNTQSTSSSSPAELSMAEKFRLAFVERDTRLAPKRAKNARQHQRRAEREWVMTSTRAKSFALASQVSRSLHGRN